MISKENLLDYLIKVDRLFPVSLSEKTDLNVYNEKLLCNADIIIHEEGSDIIGLVAGYITNSTDDKAYISLVSVLPQAQSKGIGKKLIKDFISKAMSYEKSAVHLYAVRSNIPAIKMYKSVGFEEWKIIDEPRPDDAHLIFWLRR